MGEPARDRAVRAGRPFAARYLQHRRANGDDDPLFLQIKEATTLWAHLCGGLLSRAHARSGDVARIAGYCGDEQTLDRALADFAEAYDDQTERDHAELVQAIKRGRVESES